MVKYKNIIKAIENDIIQKHSQYLINIEKALREITDSDEEYKILKEDIWKFYKETKNADHEELILKCTDGSFRENRDGDEHSVPLTDEMKQFAHDNDILYSLHNHPSCSCFQSNGDMIVFSNYSMKYGISIGKDGIMIMKNEMPYSDISSMEYFRWFNEFNSEYNNYFKVLENSVKNEFDKELNELKEKYNINFYSTTEELEAYKEERKVLWKRYTDEHIGEIIKGYDDSIKDKMYDKVNRNKLNVRAFYIPRKIKK